MAPLGVLTSANVSGALSAKIIAQGQMPGITFHTTTLAVAPTAGAKTALRAFVMNMSSSASLWHSGMGKIQF